MSAIGRVDQIGGLYDERTEIFTGLNLFLKDIDKSLITSTENFGTKFSYTSKFTIEERVNKLGMTAQLKINAMLNLFELTGSGAFLKLEKKSTRVAKASLFETVQTRYEQISITNEKFTPIVNYDLLDVVNAIHVIIGIQWGGKLIVTVEDTNIDSDSALEVEGSLGVKLQAWATQVSGEANVSFTEKEKRKFESYKFDLDGDVKVDKLPTTLYDAFAVMKNVSETLKSGNSGKGVPIRFKLLPLALLKSLWNRNRIANTIINRIETGIIKECIELLDKLDDTKRRHNDVRDDYLIYGKYIANRTLNQATGMTKISRGGIFENFSARGGVFYRKFRILTGSRVF